MISIETNISSYNATLGRYMDETKKMPNEVLDAKGRDLGIKLYQGFALHKFGGPGKKRAGLAKAELAARTAAGRGTHVRQSLVEEYLQQRAQLRSSIKSFIGPRNSRQELRTIKDRVRLWQSFVGREIALRQRGIGMLAASFLWYRGRSSQAKGIYYVKNHTGHPLGFVEKGEGFLRMVGLADGLSTVDSRYGIVASSLSTAEQDMQVYIERKLSERYSQIFGRLAA